MLGNSVDRNDVNVRFAIGRDYGRVSSAGDVSTHTTDSVAASQK